MKKALQIVLITIILTVCGHVVILNVEHMIYLNTIRYISDFENGSSVTEIKKSIAEIENNLVKIDKLENSYLPDGELADIKEYLHDNFNKMKEFDFWNSDSYKEGINQKEMFDIIKSVYEIELLGNINNYRTLAKYNSNLDVRQFIEYNYMLLVYGDYIIKPIVENYKYMSYDLLDENPDVTALNFMNLTLIRINSIKCISKLVLESGEVSE